jgi:tRNA-2-methylthio-N6-dimethylallyladenosine synthase
MLLGQTVNAYAHGGSDFGDMLAAVAEVNGIERVRFTTSHPSHMTADVAAKLGRVSKVCPYIHLPVQSGSDAILEGMRRGYTRRLYLDTIAVLRDAIAGLALSSDAIVGYPGESERDFEATVSLIEEAQLDGLFVFAYSPRPGTSAWRLADDVPEIEKQRRLQVLNDLQQHRQHARNQARIGQLEQVLFEDVSKDGRLAGRTPQFRIVHVAADRELLGKIAPVEITSASPNSLQGRLATAVH